MNTQTTNITTEKQLEPQLRFREFDDFWSEIKYGEIFSFYSTNSFSRDNLNYEDGQVKNIHYGDIHTKFSTMFNIEEEKVPYINENVDLSRIKADCYCKEGDLVIADASEDYNDIGKSIELINLNNGKLLAGLHTFLARPDKYEISKGFPGYLVQSWKIRKQIMTIAQGTKVLGLATSRLGKIKLNLPTLPEQQKIASFLTAVDTKLQQLTNKKELLQQYKKGVMQQLFSQQLRFEQHDGSDYPDWEEKKLGEIGSTLNGLTGKTKEDFGEGKPYIQYMQIFADSKINLEQCGYVSVTEGENQTRVKYGDVFFTTSSETPLEIGTSSVLLDDIEELYLNSFCFGYRPELKLQPEFARFLFRSSYFRRKIIPLAQGSTRYNMSKKELLKLKVDLPIKEEQQQIASYLAVLDTKIETVTQQIETTQLFKKGLLQQLFV